MGSDRWWRERGRPGDSNDGRSHHPLRWIPIIRDDGIGIPTNNFQGPSQDQKARLLWLAEWRQRGGAPWARREVVSTHLVNHFLTLDSNCVDEYPLPSPEHTLHLWLDSALTRFLASFACSHRYVFKPLFTPQSTTV